MGAVWPTGWSLIVCSIFPLLTHSSTAALSLRPSLLSVSREMNLATRGSSATRKRHSVGLNVKPADADAPPYKYVNVATA